MQYDDNLACGRTGASNEIWNFGAEAEAAMPWGGGWQLSVFEFVNTGRGPLHTGRHLYADFCVAL